MFPYTFNNIYNFHPATHIEGTENNYQDMNFTVEDLLEDENILNEIKLQNPNIINL